MARHITLLRFTEQGAKSIKKSTKRAQEFREAAGKAGVRVEGQYWTTGAYDGVLIMSADNEQAILRCLGALAVAGNVRTETLRAFDAAEFETIVGG